ncbi:MAG: Mur ligase family protein [Actinomycetota bacterium]|nr:Mur ligase family protein [Actinomycetota bacterium]
MLVDLGDALAWLDRHQNLERMLADRSRAIPDPARMAQLMAVLGDPQAAAPVIHVTGTNGKTSTARAIAQLLSAKGLSVGTFTSPHLESINERITAHGQAIDDDTLADLLSDVADVEGLLGPDLRPTWFEILAAAAFRFFADRPVDVAVVEVGLGGRWDATNVVDATVAVVTNVGLDHTELLGPSRSDIAGEKAGIVKERSILVLGERDPGLRAIFEREDPAELWLAGRDYGCSRNELAVGGRVLDVRTPGATYTGLWLDLHGRHQADNFATALAATEAFFAAPVEEPLVREAAATVRSPGRMEVVARQPLVILDGAKNPDGAAAAASTLSEDFGEARSRILVVGMLGGKDPEEMLSALDAGRARLVVACLAPSPRALPAGEVAAAAAAVGAQAEVVESVPDALRAAMDRATAEDLILVTGSLYVVGAARAAFAGRVPLIRYSAGPWPAPS